MRFRLTAKPPLKPFKAWFDVSDDSSVFDVLGVKAQICERVPSLVNDHGSHCSPSEITLSIDDFELLDDSSLQVIKENDLVYVSRRPCNPQKRKVTDEPETTAKRQRTQTRKRPPSSSISSTSQSSDGDESSSSDSSSSESSSESSSSSSSSDSSSSSASSIEVHSSNFPPQTPVKQNKDNSVLRAPPGQGKPSTHSRNARRRIKRIYEKVLNRLQQMAAQSVPSASANAIPLGNHGKAVTVDQPGPESLGAPQASPAIPSAKKGSPIEVESMITTLRNKNKKRGFRRTMEGLTPQRIVFSDAAPPDSTSTFYSAVSTTPATPAAVVPRLVTPSEKKSQGLLPHNMFVTSVEVEGEKWDRTKKKKQRDLYGHEYAEVKLHATEPIAEEDDTILNYGEPEPGIDWELIEKKWEDYAVVPDVSSLKVGTCVGWKALAINPITFSPENLVHLGRIKEIRHDSSVVLEPIPRIATGEIAFGIVSVAVDSQEGKVEGEGEGVGDVVYTFEDAMRASWKLID